MTDVNTAFNDKGERAFLEGVNICKEFSGVDVLKNINIKIYRGEIIGLIGENGAGKSTLIKILSGIYKQSGGKILINKQPVHLDPDQAGKLGISVIHQEFNLINELNVYENIFLGQEIRNGIFLDRQQMRNKTEELMKRLEQNIDPEAKIANLSIAQKQMVEIAKAIAYDTKVLIMDEPTTVLTPPEVRILFGLMDRLKEDGVSIVFISHRLKEVKQICDKVIVLRDGEFVSQNLIADISEKEMANQMVGRDFSQMFPAKIEVAEQTVLEVKNLSVDNLLDNINFTLKKGEILGFAGLVGAGRTELAETIIGIRNKTAGQIFINGQEKKIDSIQEAVANNIAYLPEDRKETGIITSFEIYKNVTLNSIAKYSRFLINKEKEQTVTANYIDRFNIKTPATDTLLEYLSGGNQQKVSLAKSLDTEPEIFIFDEPTRGIDVNAKKEIYLFINSLVKKGISCILISSELEEIIGLANRIIVMREGKITGTLQGDQINEEEIMYYATGLRDEVI